MLVASYSTSLQGVDAGTVLKYLVPLSDKGKTREGAGMYLHIHMLYALQSCEVNRYLSLTPSCYIDFVATYAGPKAHTRHPSIRDRRRSNPTQWLPYFSKKQVSTILMDAANHAILAGKPVDVAELLLLSGRFGVLFELMNWELDSYLNAVTP